MGRIVQTDAGGGDAAHIVGPFIARLAPGVTGRLDIGLGAGLGGEALVPKDDGVGGLAGLGAGSGPGDLGGDLGDLGLGMGRIGPADTGGGNAAHVVGPLIARLVPVVAERGRQRLNTDLRRKDRIREFCTEAGFAGLGAGGGLGDLGGGFDGLGLDVGGIVLADAGGGDAAQIFSPFIARLAPVVPKRVALGLAADRAGFRVFTGRVLPVVLVAGAQGKRHDQNQQDGQDPLQVAHSFFTVSGCLFFSIHQRRETFKKKVVKEKEKLCGGNTRPCRDQKFESQNFESQNYESLIKRTRIGIVFFHRGCYNIY